MSLRDILGGHCVVACCPSVRQSLAGFTCLFASPGLLPVFSFSTSSLNSSSSSSSSPCTGQEGSITILSLRHKDGSSSTQPSLHP
ncbi:hypothetical protein E2C01_069691 [Portunus trituberculatus]|uniref:Uncharacterized protein n=1 Tax=Portunus trituberculatus TaxID=210409 RepID=A0A5B7HZK9_PORTR|nr:hypothetical protein [Portunus trituberculatus]